MAIRAGLEKSERWLCFRTITAAAVVITLVLFCSVLFEFACYIPSASCAWLMKQAHISVRS